MNVNVGLSSEEEGEEREGGISIDGRRRMQFKWKREATRKCLNTSIILRENFSEVPPSGIGRGSSPKIILHSVRQLELGKYLHPYSLSWLPRR